MTTKRTWFTFQRAVAFKKLGALCIAALQIARVSRLYYAAGLMENNAVLKDHRRAIALSASTLRACEKTAVEQSVTERCPQDRH